MEVIVHAPKTKEGQAALTARIAKVHSDFILDYLDRLDCPVSEKERMLDRIIQIARENEQKART